MLIDPHDQAATAGPRPTDSGAHGGDTRSAAVSKAEPRPFGKRSAFRQVLQRRQKSSILGGRVLRARTPDGIDSRPGLDPDRAGFSVTLNAARDPVVHAAGVIADTVIDLIGTIGTQVLAALPPDRRLRLKTRMIKRSNSKYQARGPNVDRRSYKATTSINIVSPDP
jgi:hypothetical protein